MSLAASTRPPPSHQEQENELVANLLEQQFELVEEYCNCQTRLHNAYVEQEKRSQAPILESRIQELDQSLTKVRDNVKILNSTILRNHRRMDVLLQHIQLSERVLCTIFENGAMFHSNGIPATQDKIAVKTVALSSLKASMVQVLRKLGS